MKVADRSDHVVSETFPWMRERFLAVVGGNFHLDTPVPVRYRTHDVVRLSRDERGYLLLNVGMLSGQKEPRMQINENTWYSFGSPTDLACPPSGTLVRAEYDNGDMLSVSFVPELDQVGLARRYPQVDLATLLAPGERIAAVEISMRLGGTGLEFGPRETRFPGGGVMKNCVTVQCGVGFAFGLSLTLRSGSRCSRPRQ